MILHCQHALLFYLPTPVVASCVAIPASTKHRDNAGRRNSPVDSWWLGCAGTRFMRRLPIGLANALSQPSALVALVTISRLSSWSFSQYRDQRKFHDSGPNCHTLLTFPCKSSDVIIDALAPLPFTTLLVIK